MTCSISMRKSSRTVVPTLIFCVVVLRSFANCFTMPPTSIRSQRSPSSQPAISCIVPTTFPKIRSVSSRPWDIPPRRNSPCLRTNGYRTEKREIHIQHARNGGEKRVDDYFLDGYREETHTAYEVQGCFWHGCPKCYARDTINVYNRKTMQELHCSTVEKIKYLKRQGYNVMEVWECDVRRELKQNEEMKYYFDHYHIAEPLEPRHALYGGRTNAAKLQHCCQGDEQIRYVDFTSLYPHVNRSKTVPTGHPEIITENFDEDVSNYFGLIKCTVLPPRGLFHPVLPHHGQDKLMFALCKTCADTCNQTPCTHSDTERAIQGTWCSVEVMKALEKGYRIVQVHEVWHFPRKSDTLFKEHIDTFAKIKLEASGYPKNCVTDEQKQWYVDDILENQGIQLDPSKITYNPGLRTLSKLMLNSFWGK